MSKVCKEFQQRVKELDDVQLERKVKEMRDVCARMQGEISYASRELRRRRKDSLKR